MISLDKKYKTRSSKDVVIYSVGNQHPCSVHGSLNGEVVAWTAEGKYNPYKISNSDHDLIEVIESPQYTAENINTYNFEQLSGVAKMCMDRMLELNKG
jgi:hypothetical protein